MNIAQNSKQRPIIVIFFLLFILVIGWFGFNYFQHRGMVKTSLEAVPKESIIYVDGMVTKPGTIYLTPGVHTLKATFPDFTDAIKNIDTKDVMRSDKIYLLPAPTSDRAKAWLAQNPEVQQQREKAGGAMADSTQRLLTSKYPVLVQLPYENDDFKVDYSVTKDNKLELTITLLGVLNRPSQYDPSLYKAEYSSLKSAALKYLKNNNVNTDIVKINYLPEAPSN